MTAAATPFNAAAPPFAAKVAAAAEAFAKNPADLAPFEGLELQMQMRRKSLAMDIIRSTDEAPFADLAKILEEASNAVEELNETPALDQAQKMTEFIQLMNQRLDETAQKMRRNREDVLALDGGSRAIRQDYDCLTAMAQGLPLQYGAHEGACRDEMERFAARTLKTAQDLATQEVRLVQMLEASDKQLERIAVQQQDAAKSIERLKDATRAAEVFKDFIDSCSTGTREPVKVNKPFTLRHASFAAV